MRSSTRVRGTSALCAGLLGLLAPLASAGGSAAAEGGPLRADGPSATVSTLAGTYVVTLTAPPTAAASRSPARAARIVRAQDALLAAVGEPPVLYRFTTALNGFVADLEPAQVKALRARPEVALVERSTLQRVDTVDSPGHLGAPAAWAAVGGPERAGRDTVVGLIDTGLWPENPSFAPLDEGADRPRGFRGTCTTGDEWEASDCSSKVVAAHYFVKGFGADAIAASDYLSPRDGSGHGSHTAAVAAGNHDVQVRIDGQDLGEASGMAPAARIAVYKACWAAPDPDDDGCTTADTVAAIDQAVADGVDVLSYALSGAADGGGSESVERAFLNASAAGVFVAASAGNEGPEAGSVAHPSPWVTTVGASTHHALQGAVVLGDGTRLVGAMVSDDRVRETEVVLASDAAAPGASDHEARLCEMGALDAERVQGRLVVCDRGTTPRVEKSTEVDRAGGVGMVLANVSPDTVDADIHAVPTVHLDLADATRLREYVAGSAEPTATLDPSASDDTPVPQVAGFSSRGPAPDGDLLKPDLTAPGVGVVSATSPAADDGRLWDLASGTSAAAAHVAGLAAFVLGEHPGWSPSLVRSAMSTTARAGAGSDDPFAGGAGQVRATGLLDPGLVVEESTRRYRMFAEGRLDGSALNLPSIAVDDLTGTARVARRVTNVSGSVQSFTPTVTGLDGVTVTVRPRTLTLRRGETGRFAVLLSSTPGSALESPSSGHLTWTSGRYRARFPVVVRPRTVQAPGEVSGTGTTGSAAIEGVSGTYRDVDLTVTGLVGASPVGLTLEPGAFDVASPGGAAAQAFPLQVRAATEAVRFELDGHGTDDMDLYLYRDDTLVALASGTAADEALTVVAPEPGDYTLYVHSAAAANRSTTTAQLYTWVLEPGDAGNLEAPAAMTTSAGDRFALDVAWEGLDETRRWFGMLRFGRTDHRTFVRVN